MTTTSAVEAYLKREITTMELLYRLIDLSDEDFQTEPLGRLPPSVVDDLLELTPSVPEDQRSPRRTPRDYERMVIIHGVLASLEDRGG